MLTSSQLNPHVNRTETQLPTNTDFSANTYIAGVNPIVLNSSPPILSRNTPDVQQAVDLGFRSNHGATGSYSNTYVPGIGGVTQSEMPPVARFKTGLLNVSYTNVSLEFDHLRHTKN